LQAGLQGKAGFSKSEQEDQEDQEKQEEQKELVSVSPRRLSCFLSSFYVMPVVSIWFFRLGLTSDDQDNDAAFVIIERNKYAKIITCACA